MIGYPSSSSSNRVKVNWYVCVGKTLRAIENCPGLTSTPGSSVSLWFIEIWGLPLGACVTKYCPHHGRLVLWLP